MRLLMEMSKLEQNLFAQSPGETISKLGSTELDFILQKELMVRFPPPDSTKSTSSTKKRKATSQQDGSPAPNK